MKELDDITLKSAAKGKQTAFKQLYDHYSPVVWKVVFRTVNGDTDAAEHITQDVFIRVHKMIKKFRFNAAFSTWLYRITYNESMAYLKSRHKYSRRLVEYDDTQKARDTKDTLEDKDTVEKVLKNVSPDERFLLVAREVNDVPFEELAAITGKSAGALRTMLHRVKENIRKGFDYETGRILQQTA